MTLKYINIDNLTRKLKGRLSLVEDDNAPIYGGTTPEQRVDIDLVYTIAEQKENFLDLILDQIYNMPLRNRHPIIEDIIESLALSELIRIHFQGAGFASLGIDLSGAGADTRNHANNLIAMLTTGFNLFIPGVPTPTEYSGQPHSRRIVLRGESLRAVSPEPIIINSEFIVLNTKRDSSSNLFLQDDKTMGYFSSEFEEVRSIVDGEASDSQVKEEVNNTIDLEKLDEALLWGNSGTPSW